MLVNWDSLRVKMSDSVTPVQFPFPTNAVGEQTFKSPIG